MLSLITRRITSLLITLLLISIAIFFIMRILPGDPLNLMYGTTQGMSPDVRAALQQKLGLDKPLLIQYFYWLERFIRGDWGMSYFTGRPVFESILQRLPWTFELTVASMICVILLSLPLGILAAVKHNSKIDYSILALAAVSRSIPDFWLGVMLIIFFSLTLGLLPSYGAINPFQDFWSALKHVILPAIAMGASMLGTIIRLARSSMLEALNANYVRTARAKGLSDFSVIFVHVLKNALIPILTVIGIWFGFMMSGSVIVETVFVWPGIGQLFFQSILSRDYPVVQSLVLVMALIFVVANLVVDILYPFLDPRIRRNA